MEAELVRRARSGDEDAFASLAAGAIDRMYAVATLILRDRTAAEDAVQEALLKAWRDLPSLRDVERFQAWLRRLLVNACYDEGRRRVRRAEIRLVPEFHAGWSDAAAGVIDRDRLERGFLRLTPAQRAVIVLHHYLDLPLDELAETLGISIGTAKSRLFHARKALRAALEADDRDSEIPPTRNRSA